MPSSLRYGRVRARCPKQNSPPGALFARFSRDHLELLQNECLNIFPWTPFLTIYYTSINCECQGGLSYLVRWSTIAPGVTANAGIPLEFQTCGKRLSA